MKSLRTIQTLSKIGMILSKIVYIFCIIGTVGCVIGMICLHFAETGVLKIYGMSIHSLISNNAGIDLMDLYPAMTGMMILCIGRACLQNLQKPISETNWPPEHLLPMTAQRKYFALAS